VNTRETNGWIDWGISGTQVLLKDLWNDYVERFGGELEDDIDEDEEVDEDEED
jgi:hypothetical protein